MSAQTKEGQFLFEVQAPEPDIYPLSAVLKGSEVFVTVCAKTAMLGNSHEAKKVAYETRMHEKVSMREAGIESMGAAFPVDPEGVPVRIVDSKEAVIETLRYHRVFRLRL